MGDDGQMILDNSFASLLRNGKRNDITLLEKAEIMSNGGTWEKVLAVNLLMDHFMALSKRKK